MDYGSPVAISKFVHYFYVPQVKDYRTDPLLLSSSFTAVNVYRSDDGGEWKLAERREALRPGWPQVIALSQPEPARHYKLEITSLTAGAEGIRTYEVESFMGPVIYDAITAPALLMSGQQTKLRGLVIAPRPGLAISVARSEPVEPEKKRVLVSANGRFTVPLTPLRAGAVPVMLELKDDENTVLDSCEVIFRAAPRVAVGNLKVIGDTLSGRLLNTSTVALSVAVRNGRSSTPALRLDSGAGSEFSLSGAITGAGRQVVKFWIWTRVINCRTYFNSYAHVDEQWGWPPGTYLAPMFGLAAQTAYRLSEDELFRKMAGAAKTCGWWTVRKTAHSIQPPEAPPATVGAGFWPNEATAFVPLEGPLDVTFWVDWVSSQQFLICLRWLVQEVNLRSAGRIAVDPVTLSGNVLGRPGKLALRAEEVQVEAPHQQVNWLGYRTDRSHVLVLINDDAAVTAKVSFPLLDTSPATVSTTTDGKQWRQEKPRTGGPLEIALPAESSALIAWQLGNSGGNSEHRGPRVT